MFFGLRGGVNLANQKQENLTDSETISARTLLLAGGQFDYWFNDSWAMSFQLLYNQKGAHLGMNVGEFAFLGILGLSSADWIGKYLEIPLLVKASLSNGAVRPYIFAGPSFGILLSNTEVLHYTGHTFAFGPPGVALSSDTTANITDSTAKIDFSIVAGAGISVTLDSGPVLFLEAAYAFGLTNVDNYFADNANDRYIYSRDIRIAAGVMFPLN